jgi:hypothetical protein
MILIYGHKRKRGPQDKNLPSSATGLGLSDSLRQPDYLTLTGHIDQTARLNGFASLLHNRFAFIVAIEVKRAIYLTRY